eukprot:TRINITY_DN60813_c0_g1_i2.p1 TRINITY_DN60813_c0_g1~~TRINITY_DN60813_c0_g1_i2.p1  ORF type:complete len:343 (-),score=39.10 TRINITY_DN60813_c0_g1_i2:517-1545(-)
MCETACGVALGVGGTLTAILILFLVFFVVHTRRKHASRNQPQHAPPFHSLPPTALASSLRPFTVPIGTAPEHRKTRTPPPTLREFPHIINIDGSVYCKANTTNYNRLPTTRSPLTPQRPTAGAVVGGSSPLISERGSDIGMLSLYAEDDDQSTVHVHRPSTHLYDAHGYRTSGRGSIFDTDLDVHLFPPTLHRTGTTWEEEPFDESDDDCVLSMGGGIWENDDVRRSSFDSSRDRDRSSPPRGRNSPRSPPPRGTFKFINEDNLDLVDFGPIAVMDYDEDGVSTCINLAHREPRRGGPPSTPGALTFSIPPPPPLPPPPPPVHVNSPPPSPRGGRRREYMWE